MIFRNAKKNEDILQIMKKISEADNFNRMTHFFQLLNIIENERF
jgi:hypothetical protein